MTASRTDLNTGTIAVRNGFEIDVLTLQSWMQSNVPGFSGPLAIEQFKGGQSNPTYKLTTARSSYVLRRKPLGQLLATAHAVDREYRVLDALSRTDVPVPRPYGLCTDESVIGSWFYVMEFKAGRIFWDLVLPEQSSDTRRQLWTGAIEAMARLHNADFQALGLSDYGRPGAYFARQFKRWSEQYEYTRNGVDNPSLSRLIEWLSTHTIDDERASVVHGDLQFSNMVFHSTGHSVEAFLDWELSTLGNPLSDLAYFCRVYHLPAEHGGLLGLDRRGLGIPDEEEVKAWYCERTGRQRIDNWHVYVVFSMFRLAAIRQGVAKRIKDGTATSSHAKNVAMGAIAVADAAWTLAQSIN